MDGALCVGVVRHLDEGEAAGTTGVPVGDDASAGDLAAILLERLDQVVFLRVEGEVSYVESIRHFYRVVSDAVHVS